MKTQEQLIAWYTKHLEKAILVWKDDHRGDSHIKFAEKQLEAVKNGRTW